NGVDESNSRLLPRVLQFPGTFGGARAEELPRPPNDTIQPLAGLGDRILRETTSGRPVCNVSFGSPTTVSLRMAISQTRVVPSIDRETRDLPSERQTANRTISLYPSSVSRSVGSSALR